MVVDHINEDRLDNRACNLQWLTDRQNREKSMKSRGVWYNPDAWHPGKPRKIYERPEDTPAETWKEITDFPGYYVSDQGRIWSESRGLRPTNARAISIKRGSVRKHVSIRALVAEAFLPPKQDGEIIGHRNGDTRDRRASNLFWYQPYRPMSHKRGPRKKEAVGGQNLSGQNRSKPRPQSRRRAVEIGGLSELRPAPTSRARTRLPAGTYSIT